MSGLKTKEILAFVPSGEDYELALRFFVDLGFEVQWKSDQLAVMKLGACRFFLQKFANTELQKNFMMSLEVEDLDLWWAKINCANLPAKYPGVKVRAPADYPWGKREIHVIDPAGVLWHICVPA